MPEQAQYAIAVIGGATAGAEAAGIFSGRGILTVVFEQNPRPYGKIEDGLPRWHHALRNKEYETIDSKLGRSNVHVIPHTCVGRDVELRELAEDWGFHAVLLANGAWRDRPLPIEGAGDYVGRGLVYQNPFIMWFNHKQERGYTGESFAVADRTIVVGGGLASIDVVKVIQLELTLGELGRRGIEQDLIELEVKGIPRALEAHGLRFEELGIEGCTLYYRRRAEDMPLIAMPEGVSDVQAAKVAQSRKRVLEKAMEKYRFRFEPLHAPVDLVVEDGRVAGLVFAQTRVEGTRVSLSDERVSVRAPLVISSIGSIPEPIEGVPLKGELYAFEDWNLGRLPGFPTLFSAGNVVTGKGNIVESRKHSRMVAGYVTEEYLKLAKAVRALPPLSPEQGSALLDRIRKAQARVGYAGDYSQWIASLKPE